MDHSSGTAAPVALRRAVEADLPAIVALLADDGLGRRREDPGPPLNTRYAAAFAALQADTNQLLAVAEAGGAVVGVLQISFIPGIARLGAMRGQIEGVRIAARHRGTGLGKRMMVWAIDQCRRRGCTLVQLTSDRQRPEAHRFYEGLGFTPSHVGFKLPL